MLQPTTTDKAVPKNPNEVERKAKEIVARAPAVVRRHPWERGDRVTVDYADGSTPYDGTVGSVGAHGEVTVDFEVDTS